MTLFHFHSFIHSFIQKKILSIYSNMILEGRRSGPVIAAILLLIFDLHKIKSEDAVEVIITEVSEAHREVGGKVGTDPFFLFLAACCENNSQQKRARNPTISSEIR